MRIPGLGGMMSHLREQMQAFQESLENTQLEAAALEGRIRVLAKGTGEYIQVQIDAALLSPEQQATLEAGLLEALQQMHEKLQEFGREQMVGMGGGLGGRLEGLLGKG